MRPFIQFSSRYILKSDEFYLAFNIDEDWFAANFPKIAGFSKDYSFNRYQGKTTYITGVACVNNELLPVIDLKKKIGMESASFRNTGKLAVIETELFDNTLRFAVFYDNIGDAFELSSKKILPTPNIGEPFVSRNIKGVHIHQDQCIMLLDFDTIFSIDDLIDIKIAFKNNPDTIETYLEENNQYS